MLNCSLDMDLYVLHIKCGLTDLKNFPSLRTIAAATPSDMILVWGPLRAVPYR
jgi:hypothetical protein